jgi:hypothetical protein
MLAVEDKYQFLFRNHPTKENFDKETIIAEILRDDDIMKYFSEN